MRCVPRSLMYSSRPKARTAHVGIARLAHQNPLFMDAEPGLLRSREAWAYVSTCGTRRIRFRDLLQDGGVEAVGGVVGQHHVDGGLGGAAAQLAGALF